MVDEKIEKKPVQPVMSLHDRILSAKDEKTELLYVPEWDVTVLCKSLTGKDRAELSQLVRYNTAGEIENDATSADIVIMATYDPETGKPIFTDAEKPALQLKHTGALETVAGVINRLSGITPITEGRVKKAEKN